MNYNVDFNSLGSSILQGYGNIIHIIIQLLGTILCVIVILRLIHFIRRLIVNIQIKKGEKHWFNHHNGPSIYKNKF